jgi:hypothetical protein
MLAVNRAKDRHAIVSAAGQKFLEEALVDEAPD